MIEVSTNLFIGSEVNCSFEALKDRATVHACKNPCHARVLNYRGSLPQTHPNYLVLEWELDLYLNMVDMDRELSPVYTNPIVQAAMSFIDKNITDRPVVIHCNQGMSRAPSIALLYMARTKAIKNDSFEDAVRDFRSTYPAYQPARGISLYMSRNWSTILSL